MLPAEITIYTDGSFTFVLRTPPAAVLLRKAASVLKGSGVPNKDKVGKVTREQVKEIAELKQFSFVIWQTGWKSLGPQFEAEYRPDANGVFPKNYFQAPNQLSQNKMFWLGRVPIIIVDKTIFEHHKKILRNDYDTAVPLRYHDIFGGKTSYSVAFSQANLRDQFNAGLKKIRLNGEYQRIINAYL